jgi:hypothetical protein
MNQTRGWQRQWALEMIFITVPDKAGTVAVMMVDRVKSMFYLGKRFLVLMRRLI